jgi:NADPH2:quinone reductase
MADVVRWCAEGKLSGQVHRSYPLAETPAAIRVIANREAMGKVVVCP